jgi:hypothetical protein
MLIDCRLVSETVRDIFAHWAGQDDNLGDSALRAAYMSAVKSPSARLHVFLGEPTADYVSGLPLTVEDQVYQKRSRWVAKQDSLRNPVRVLNAGEINPSRGVFPSTQESLEIRRLLNAGGVLIAAGIGLKDPQAARTIQFDQVLRDASIMSWRDEPSRDAAGFGEVVPDWAFALGSPTDDWARPASRPLLSVTMRFDRAWPDQPWFDAVRRLAAHTSTRIVTVAQVARDAPRAVRLAEALDGEYLVAPSTRHADLAEHVRGIFRQSIAVVSDRAHGLIIGATEGAYPVGSGEDPQKICRLLMTAGVGSLVGRYDELPGFVARFADELPGLAAAIDSARDAVSDITRRIRATLDAQE